MAPVSLLAVLLFLAVLGAGFLFWLWRRARQRQASLKAALEASQARSRQMMGVAELAMAVLDDCCHVVDWNPSLEKLYACRLEEALGQQFFLRFAPPGEGVALTARAMAMRTSDEVFEFTWPVPVENGSPRIVHWRARHFTDPADERRYLSLVGNDVTALESALTELGGSEARLRLMFGSVPVALALVDPEGRLRMINAAWAEFFGYDAPEQMVALNVIDLVHPDDRAASNMALAAVRARAEPLYQMETCYVRRDGISRWGHARGVLIELSPGQHFFLTQISDIHERKQTERALMESERRLATLIANLSGAVYRYELRSGRIELHHDSTPEFLSEGVESMTGHMRSQFLLRDDPHVLGNLILEEDRPLVVKVLAAAMAGDGRFEVTYRLHHGNSGMRWVSEHGLAWQRPDGSWTVDGHITDITAERQARDAEQVYRRLVADTNTGYLCLSATGRIVEVNQPYCRLFGLSGPEEAHGRLLEEVFPTHVNLVRGFLEIVLREGGVHDAELGYTLPTGQTVHALTSAIAVQEGGQRLVKCLLVDITRTRRAERARKESEQRYRTLFNTSVTGICFLSLDGHVEEANPALCSLLGFAEADSSLLGMNLREVTVAAWQEADAAAREQILMRGWCDPYRKEFQRGDGSTVPVSIQAWMVRDEHDHPQRIMCMVTDISSLHPEAEQAAQESLRPRSVRKTLE